MKNLYKSIENEISKKIGVKEFESRIKLAQLYWNPRNFSDGSDIAFENDWDKLFDQVIKEETGSNRWLFNFHDFDMEELDENSIMIMLLKSKNYKKYEALWKEHAPKKIRNRFILMYALAEMTYRGVQAEKAFKDAKRKEGKKVFKSTAKEDRAGIDYWVDGQPVQVKSRGTIRAARSRNEEIL